MADYDGDKPYDFAISVYEGQDTADRAYDAVKALEKDGVLSLHDAAVIYRTDSGKVKLKNKGFVAGWKGGGIGLLVGALLGGPLLGAAVGGFVGWVRGDERRDLKDQVGDHLGPDDSALAIVAENADWDAVAAAMEPFGAAFTYAELKGDALSKLEELTSDTEVTGAAEMDFEEVDSD